MKPSVAATRSAKDRFLREAQFTAAIEHDNIVNIYQVGEDQGVPFIAMPFLKGESLKTQLEREGKLSQTDVLKIGVQVASGLAAAHEPIPRVAGFVRIRKPLTPPRLNSHEFSYTLVQ